MKYAFFRNYTEQFRAAVAYFHDNGGFVTPCVSQIANEARSIARSTSPAALRRERNSPPAARRWVSPLVGSPDV